MDMVTADTEDSAVDVTEDKDEVDDAVDDKVHLRRQRKTTTYIRSEGRLPPSLVEEQDHSMPQTLSNVSIIGIIVSHAAST